MRIRLHVTAGADGGSQISTVDGGLGVLLHNQECSAGKRVAEERSQIRIGCAEQARLKFGAGSNTVRLLASFTNS